MRRKSSSNTKGRRLLEEHVKKSSQTALAREIGVSQQTVSDWVSGSCRPDALMRTLLEKLTGIRATSWFDAREAQRIARAAAA